MREHAGPLADFKKLYRQSCCVVMQERAKGMMRAKGKGSRTRVCAFLMVSFSGRF